MSVHDCAQPANASRRSFLKRSAALAGAVAVGGPLGRSALAQDAADAEYGGLKMGLQSYSLRDRPLDKMLEAMKTDLKLRYVEMYPGHVLPTTTPPQVKEKLAAAGVTMASYGVVKFTKSETVNRAMFEIAKTYGLKNLSCNPDPSKECFDSLEKLTEEYGVTVAIHPHGPEDKNWSTAALLRKGYEGRSTRIGLCADTGHLIRSGEDPLKVMEEFKDRVHALHLKDFKKLGEKDGKTQWEDVPAGTAALDVDGVVKFLVQQKFQGHVFIEYEGKQPVESIQQSLARVREAAKKAAA